MNRRLFTKEDPCFGSIRVITADGEKWFSGSDVSEMIGYHPETISVYIKNYVDDSNKIVISNNEFAEVKRKSIFVNEAGLKQLERKNHKMADGFLEWITQDSFDKEADDGVVDASDKAEEIIYEAKEDLSVFNNPIFGSIRMVERNGEPWFSGIDVATSLGYKNGSRDIDRHVFEEDKSEYRNGSLHMTLINESGLYSLIMSSKLPNAKEFKRWVTSEVLPSIRKHGAFMTPDTIEKVLHNPDFIIQLATELKNEQAKNKNLTATNAALVEKSSEWDHRSILNALMRAYAKKMPGGVFAYAWDALYKELRYNAHIDVDIRYSKRKNEKDRRIDMIKPQEMETVIKIAVAMCEKKDIDTGNVINGVNAGRFQEAV